MLCENIEGDDSEILSEATPYAFDGIDGNGNLIPRRSDNGMNIEDCLKLLQVVGACSRKVIGEYDWEGYRRGRWPEDWPESAALHRIAEAWDCADEQAVMSAVALGHPVVYGSDGHAVIAIGFDKDGIIILNSWGSSWGKNGIGRWPSNEIPSYGAWALRCTTADDAPRTDVGTQQIRRRKRRRWGR